MVKEVVCKYRPRVKQSVNLLNLEAGVLGVLGVLALGRVQGRVVAGRFWCSYAWVSLTQTACARPRGCLPACLQACVRVCTGVRSL